MSDLRRKTHRVKELSMAKKKNAKTETEEVADQDFSFEDAMTQIEAIVLNLESGKLKLGDSLEQYETAIGKLKRCHEYLEFAERQVSLLSGVDAEGNPVTVPLADETDKHELDLSTKQASRGARRGATKQSSKRAKKSGRSPSESGDDLSGEDGSAGLF